MNPGTDDKNVAELVASCQGIVRSLAWKIHRRVSRYVELDDLIGYGHVGLAQAARDFDPSRGVKFTTYAYHRIRGAIFDGLSNYRWFTRSEYFRGRYDPLAADAAGSNENDEDSLEGDVRWFRSTTRSLAVVHLFCQLDDHRRDFSDGNAQSPEESVVQRELAGRVTELVEDLPEAARDLVRAVYFDGVSLTDAAANLGISKSWASRLHAKALDQLARGLQPAVAGRR